MVSESSFYKDFMRPTPVFVQLVVFISTLAAACTDPPKPAATTDTSSATDTILGDSASADTAGEVTASDVNSADGAISADASTPDIGTPDSGTPDAGSPDTGTQDTGTQDTGTPNAADTTADVTADGSSDVVVDVAADVTGDIGSSGDATVGPCYADSDCGQGKLCLANAQGCNGICTKPHGLGESCTDGVPCVTGHYCDQVCIAYHKAGEDCFDGILCEPKANCSIGGTCKIPQESAEGGKCYDGNYCAPGLWCEQTSSISSKTCVKPIAIGGVCDKDVQCGLGHLCKDAVCAQAPGEGGACSTVGSKAQCLVGMICAGLLGPSTTATACLPIKKLSESCTSNDQCQEPGQFCKGLVKALDVGTCQPLPKAGESCAAFAAPWSAAPSCQSALKCAAKAGVPTCMSVAEACTLAKANGP